MSYIASVSSLAPSLYETANMLAYIMPSPGALGAEMYTVRPSCTAGKPSMVVDVGLPTKPCASYHAAGLKKSPLLTMRIPIASPESSSTSKKYSLMTLFAFEAGGRTTVTVGKSSLSPSSPASRQ